MAKARARARQTIPKDESKADRFIRVVTPRIAKAMKAIRVIGFCAGAGYEYTPAQVKQIATALGAAVDRVNKQFTEKKADEPEFEFKD